MMAKRGPTSNGIGDRAGQLIIGLSRIDGVRTIGRRRDDVAATRLDNRDAKFVIGRSPIGHADKRIGG